MWLSSGDAPRVRTFGYLSIKDRDGRSIIPILVGAIEVAIARLRGQFNFSPRSASCPRSGRGTLSCYRAGSCCSAQVLPSGSLKVTKEPHG